MAFIAVLNQFSYVIFSALSLAVAYLGLHAVSKAQPRFNASWLNISLLSLGVILTAGFLFVRPGLGNVQSPAQVQALIQNGRPTVIEFYSNYCIGCMGIEPQMQALTEDLSPTHDVLRVDIHSALGRKLRQEIDFHYTPEIIVFNYQGDEIWRGHHIPQKSVIRRSTTQATANGH